MSEQITQVYVDTLNGRAFIGYSGEPAPDAILAQAKRIADLEAEVAELKAVLQELAGTS